jgi:hypothetical protein
MEYVKDEQLAPWNYAGFEYMNEAGKLQAEFGSSLLLTSERGGFVVPAAPSGVSLARALLEYGPLVTNISVSVSQAGVKTTFKMDSYTASFGKMQKQVKDMITNISRNKQQQKDERNAMIRKGIAKNQTNLNYSKLYSRIDNAMKSSNDYRSNLDFTNGSTATSPADFYVMTAFKKQSPAISRSASTYGAGPNASSNNITQDQRFVEGSMMPSQMIGDAAGVLNTNMEDFAFKFYNSAGSNFVDEHAPASFEPDHPNMSSVGKPGIEFIDYINEIDGFDENIQITQWGK